MLHVLTTLSNVESFLLTGAVNFLIVKETFVHAGGGGREVTILCNILFNADMIKEYFMKENSVKDFIFISISVKCICN